jgi:hypothetical protein
VDQMKKKLHPAKAPLPKFRSDKEAAEFFETHSVADVWDQLPMEQPARPSADLAWLSRSGSATNPRPHSWSGDGIIDA